MRHIGKREFYDEVAVKVDSLQKIGYSVFYENVSDEKEIDSFSHYNHHHKIKKVNGHFSCKIYRDQYRYYSRQTDL